MNTTVVESAHGSTAKEAVARWWPVVAAIVGSLLYPPVGILFALIMAFMRRWDRVVMFTLLGVAALGLLWLSLFLGVARGGVGSSGG